MASPANLMDMDLNKMSEIDFRVAVMKTIVRLEKTINGNIDQLRAKVRADPAEFKNAINEIQPNLDTLTELMRQKNELVI